MENSKKDVFHQKELNWMWVLISTFGWFNVHNRSNSSYSKYKFIVFIQNLVDMNVNPTKGRREVLIGLSVLSDILGYITTNDVTTYILMRTESRGGNQFNGSYD